MENNLNSITVTAEEIMQAMAAKVAAEGPKLAPDLAERRRQDGTRYKWRGGFQTERIPAPLPERGKNREYAAFYFKGILPSGEDKTLLGFFRLRSSPYLDFKLVIPAGFCRHDDIKVVMLAKDQPLAAGLEPIRRATHSGVLDQIDNAFGAPSGFEARRWRTASPRKIRGITVLAKPLGEIYAGLKPGWRSPTTESKPVLQQQIRKNETPVRREADGRFVVGLTSPTLIRWKRGGASLVLPGGEVRPLVPESLGLIAGGTPAALTIIDRYLGTGDRTFAHFTGRPGPDGLLRLSKPLPEIYVIGATQDDVEIGEKVELPATPVQADTPK